MTAAEKETVEKKENGTLELEKIYENRTMELENVKKTVGNDHDEPKINYRGWKAMPFIIGELEWAACFLPSCFFFLLLLLLCCLFFSFPIIVVFTVE